MEKTYDYPLAGEILTEKNIVLKRGDGHITLADCASEPGLLEVWARSRSKVCFKVTGNSGWLTLEIPAVYGIRGSAAQTARVDMTVGTEEKSFDVAEDAFTPVGESADEQGRDHLARRDQDLQVAAANDQMVDVRSRPRKNRPARPACREPSPSRPAVIPQHRHSR